MRKIRNPPKKAPPAGAAICAKLIELSRHQRQELAIELLIEIAVPLLRQERLNSEDAFAPTDLVHRCWGASYACWGEEPAPIAKMLLVLPKACMSETMLLWQVLGRIIEVADGLAEDDSSGRRVRLGHLIRTWRDCWGDDRQAQFARRSFRRITGRACGKAELRSYLHTTLAEELEASGAAHG